MTRLGACAIARREWTHNLVALKRRYPGLKFSPQTIKEAVSKLDEIRLRGLATPGAPPGYAESIAEMDSRALEFVVALESGDEWQVDSRSEFYELYRTPNITRASLANPRRPPFELRFAIYDGTEVKMTHGDRAEIYELFEIFETGAKDASSSYPVAESATMTVFLGHGNSATWRELKEFLELHGIRVVTYETEKRHGYSVKETLEAMLHSCNFAVLIHTAEDEQQDGAIRARQNVVHETGLFQGRLGFARAIVVREARCNSFSNVDGINEIRYNSPKEAFGEVLLAIRRELEDPSGPGRLLAR